MKGKVRWFSKERGHGYIAVENGKDHFFHISDVDGADLPGEGDTVEFESRDNKKGKRAYSVEILSKSLHAVSNKYQDYRMTCNSCGRKMTPRTVYKYHRPERSICPFCGEFIEEYASYRRHRVFQENALLCMAIFILCIVIISKIKG